MIQGPCIALVMCLSSDRRLFNGFLFQDNLGKPAPENLKQQTMDLIQIICSSTLLQTDNHTSTSSLNFYRPDAVPDAQPTADSVKVKALKAAQSTEGGFVCHLNTMLNEIWLTVPSWKMAGICDSADDDGVDAGNMAAVVREIRVIRSLSISRYVAAHE